MVKRKVLIVTMRERRARDIWKSPEQRESCRLNMSSRPDLAMRGEWEKEEQTRQAREHIPKIVGLQGMRSWGREAQELEMFRVGDGLEEP